MKIKTIYESEEVIIKTTGHDYDFIATIQNVSNRDIQITFIGKMDYLEPIMVEYDEWVGIEADEVGYEQLEALIIGNFYTEYVENSVLDCLAIWS